MVLAECGVSQRALGGPRGSVGGVPGNSRQFWGNMKGPRGVLEGSEGLSRDPG